MRLGINRDWKSRWFGESDSYVENLHQDIKIRELVKKALRSAGLDLVDISRSAGKLTVSAFVAKPGVAIGRSGSGIEELIKKIKKIVGTKIEVDVKITEVKRPELSARAIALEIASGIERRMRPKLLVQNAIAKARSAGAKGVKIWVSGRINGVAQARTIKHNDGAVPLHTLKANIDYAFEKATTKDLGILGVKVWVYKPGNETNSDQK
ncbi:30S ribosomal protein S3 [Candidatus Dojkabacteria bacterium]|uniref:Small ribosomal subunit protein uS3 n=1 Tax=Candidatus Dojkabacteria bacterium TaxID=2099670 RepID=A0A955HZX7_9BACT|nr:30S ribosomal protein S3 [Candidatus Dojkabacteria bacterium]MCB9790803.1 30S ribosomal protein S3 [Candidatus Nomurabacteria bacterium]